MWRKMIKNLKIAWRNWCLIQAGAGTVADDSARVTGDPDSPHGKMLGFLAESDRQTSGEMSAFPLPGVSKRMQELIELGLVSKPDGLGDLTRVESWLQDWKAREASGAAHCPCSGRHYPSPSACRWCKCHDPNFVHHTPGVLTLEETIRIKADPEAQETFQEIIREGMIRASYRPCNVCGDPSHAGVVHSEIMLSRGEQARGLHPAGDAEITIIPLDEKGNPVTESAVRPSNKIVVCGACGHPDHTANGGRCAFLDASDPALPVCGCRAGTDRLEVTE